MHSTHQWHAVMQAEDLQITFRSRATVPVRGGKPPHATFRRGCGASTDQATPSPMLLGAGSVEPLPAVAPATTPPRPRDHSPAVRGNHADISSRRLCRPRARIGHLRLLHDWATEHDG